MAVLYAAPTIDTCLLELLRQWPAASNAAIAAGVPAPILPKDALDAGVDVKIAAASRRCRIPPYVYERDAVYGESASPLTLLDLSDFITMQRLERDPGVEREMACCGYSQMDRGALLAVGADPAPAPNASDNKRRAAGCFRGRTFRRRARG